LYLCPNQVVIVIFNSAQQDCVSRGGELAVIQNKEVQARVFNLTSATKYKVDVWIGLHDLHQEGNWEWVNGRRFFYKMFYSI
jgi:hypothetical protein